MRPDPDLEPSVTAPQAEIPSPGGVSRRTILRGGAALGAGALGGARRGIGSQTSEALRPRVEVPHIHGAGGSGPVRDIEPGGFDPTAFATRFDGGLVSTLPDGRTLRAHHFVAVDREIEVAPGVWFPAWTYNGSVPGTT